MRDGWIREAFDNNRRELDKLPASVKRMAAIPCLEEERMTAADETLARLRRDPLRELDAEIAVKVLGWTGPVEWHGPVIVGTQRPGAAAARPKYPPHPLEPHAKPAVWPAGLGTLIEVPRYSGDIADVWEVVEEMNKRGWRFDFTQKAAGDWLVRLHRSDPAEPRPIHIAHANAPTAPEAICRASLAAIEVVAT